MTPPQKPENHAPPLLCRLGLHRYANFPDPNPETRGLEQQGYRACLHCPKETDGPVRLPRLAQQWWPTREYR